MSYVRKEELAEGIVLYQGDMMDVLPLVDDRHTLAFDPPYGIEFGYASYDDTEEAFTRAVRATQGRPVALLQYPEEMMRLVCPILGAPQEVLGWVYGSNLPRQLRLWGFWGCDVDPARSKQMARNPEAAKVKSLVVAGYDWREIPQVKNTSPDKTGHPCQLPLQAAIWVLECLNAERVCDPFMGSGTMGVAAVKLGRKFTGIEIDPGYFDIACRRIAAALKEPDFFHHVPAPLPKQEALL